MKMGRNYEMENKKLLIGFVGLVLVVVMSFSLVYSGTETVDGNYTDITEVGGDFGLNPSEVVVEKVLISRDSSGVSTITFSGKRWTDGSSIEIKGNKFENIVERDGKQSILKLDKNGNIVEAHLRVSYNKEAVLNIDGTERHFPPGSIIDYKDGKLSAYIPEYDMKTQQKFGIKGSNNGGEVFLTGPGAGIHTDDGRFIPMVGGVYYDGEYYLRDENFVYKGVSVLNSLGNDISESEKLIIYADGKEHGDTEAYLSLGMDNIIASTGSFGGDLNIVFDDKYEYGDYFKSRIKKPTYVGDLTSDEKAELDAFNNVGVMVQLSAPGSVVKFGYNGKSVPTFELEGETSLGIGTGVDFDSSSHKLYISNTGPATAREAYVKHEGTEVKTLAYVNYKSETSYKRIVDVGEGIKSIVRTGVFKIHPGNKN